MRVLHERCQFYMKGANCVEYKVWIWITQGAEICSRMPKCCGLTCRKFWNMPKVQNIHHISVRKLQFMHLIKSAPCVWNFGILQIHKIPHLVKKWHLPSNSHSECFSAPQIWRLDGFWQIWHLYHKQGKNLALAWTRPLVANELHNRSGLRSKNIALSGTFWQIFSYLEDLYNTHHICIYLVFQAQIQASLDHAHEAWNYLHTQWQGTLPSGVWWAVLTLQASGLSMENVVQ